MSTSMNVAINGVHISSIHRFALRKSGNQTFRNPVIIDHVFSDNVWTSMLNGLPVNDLLLLSDEQIVTGILQFFDASVSNMAVGSINFIPVDSFVTIDSVQGIRDIKNINFLQSRTIDVQGQTNEKDLWEFSEKVVSIIDDDEIPAQLKMESTVEIMEDVYLIGLMNNLIDLQRLATYGVLKHTEQTLKGPFVFSSHLHVLENLVIGQVNNINTDHLVTLASEQTISGDIVFEELLTVKVDLISDRINGIDLDKTAVKKTTDAQFVNGFVTFNQLLVAEDIFMTEYVTLDTVDPSLLVQDIVKHKEGVVKSDVTIFHDVVVLGHLVVSEGVNGHNISDLPTNVWLKTTKQTIELPMHLIKVTAGADVEVTTVNNIRLDTEVAHSFKDETILSVKTFLNEVVVPEQLNTNQVIFNGLDVDSLKNEMDRYPSDGKIHGQKTLQTLEIHGNVAAKLFNDLQVDDLMHPTIPQKVHGDVEFSSGSTVIQNILFTDTLNFNTFKGIDLRTFVEEAVVKRPKYAVANKGFSIIEGQHMVLKGNSTLGGVSFSGMLDRIVTLDTQQEINAPKTFMDDIQLQKSSVSNLNGREWDELIGTVVLVDSYSHINSPKIFIGDIKTQHVTVGLIRDINITLMAESAFYKSQDNEVVPEVHFLNYITTESLHWYTSIDGMNWEHLIHTQENENLGDIVFLSETALTSNMRVDGLLNDCDIVQLGQKAVYAKKATQFIKERVVIQELKVMGNLHLKQEVNQISIEDLQRQFITIAGDQVITSDVHVGSNVKVVVLNLVDLMNDVDISWILNDAVRQSIPQEISGFKSFENVSANTLAVNDLFIIESLNDIDPNELFNNAVWKVGDQIIDGDKTFLTFGSKVAEIYGAVNGLSLPEDVVRTDTTDQIAGRTIFKSDTTTGSDVVIHGELNGMDLLHFIFNRITLSGEQHISSILSLTQDIRIQGHLLVDETINDIPLDLVCKVKQAFPLEGFKSFKDFYVDGPLTASSINGYDLLKMDHGILRKNRDETLNKMQVFANFLQAENSLSTERINGKSLPEMIKAYLAMSGNYNRTLYYYVDVSNSLIEHLTDQLQASAGQLSNFAHVFLVQEIADLGPTIKILHGHDLGYAAGEFSHSMVLWTSKKQCASSYQCCRTEFSHWMRVERSGHLVIDSHPEQGRYYPIQNPDPVTVDKNFVFWTGSVSEQSKWCNNSMSEELLLASLGVSGTMEVFMRIKSAPSLSEVKSFWRTRLLFAVAGYYFDRNEDEYSSAVVYVFNEVRRKWQERQHLRSFGVLSLDITHNKQEDEILLAIGTGMGTYSSIYKWNDKRNEFDILQNIPPKFVTSTLWLKRGPVQLLAMSSVDHWPREGGDCVKFLSGGRIDIYLFEGRAKWIQSIPLRGVVSMISLTLEGDTYLIAASHQLQTLFIYEWKGYAGFSLIQSVFVGEVRHLNTYSIADDVYITIAVTNGPSKLLKVVFQGKHNVTAAVRKQIVSRELKDEAARDEKLVPRC